MRCGQATAHRFADVHLTSAHSKCPAALHRSHLCVQLARRASESMQHRSALMQGLMHYGREARDVPVDRNGGTCYTLVTLLFGSNAVEAALHQETPYR